jgi:hypothetical protein
MDHRVTALERAFQLARSGKVSGLSDIRKVLGRKLMVKFDNKDVSLWTAVHDIMSRPAVKRTGTAVFRAEGKKPSILDAADIESIAQLPAFEGPQPPHSGAFNED